MQSFCLRNHSALLWGALLIRLILIIYGTYQDEWFEVKYSDIDYSVVTDGARFVLEGESPYLRATYRYSPFLAYLLMPNILFHASVGKLVFVMFDFVGARITRKLAEAMRFNSEQSKLCELVYLFNPLSIGISTRGSGDSIICALVLGLIWGLVEIKRRQNLDVVLLCGTAAVHGFSMHWRLFPIIFAPTILVFLDTWPKRILFGLTSFAVFAALLVVFYLTYGMDFIWETFLYHAMRKDTRHNFSVWFYSTYLQATHLGLATMVPQLIVQLALIARFAKRDVLFCFLLQTWAFVVFNRVVTAQYFLWYFALLPIVLMLQMDLTWLEIGLKVLLPWTAGELTWLASAYRIEFLGDTRGFELVFASGIVFFAINVYCMCKLIASYRCIAGNQRELKQE